MPKIGSKINLELSLKNVLGRILIELRDIGVRFTTHKELKDMLNYKMNK